MPKLYALVVGVNQYNAQTRLTGGISFPPLKGCASDAGKMKDYIEAQSGYEVHTQILLNEQATKSSIVTVFKEHLGKAGKEDVVFFYYSGHGTQEIADKVWTSDSDGRLECLVCYYDETTKDPFLLSDKELRYLINQVYSNKPHIVTLFDCCHSGEITRNGAINMAAFEEAVEKRGLITFPMREWKDFIFSGEVSRDDVLNKGEHMALPEGLHIQLSACESDESAMEVAGEGVFTKALLHVLHATDGNITYYALRSRVRQYLRTIYEQKPRIYTPAGNDESLYSVFLHNSSFSNKTFGEVVYNDRSGWLLNLGAIQGIGRKAEELQLFDTATQEPVCKARIELIKTDYTEVTPEKEIDESKVYFAYVEGHLSQTIKVFVDNVDGPVADGEALVQALMDADGTILLENEESKADYALRCRYGAYYITSILDPFRPLSTPVPMGSDVAPLEIVKQLKHIARWEFIRNLTNEESDTRLSLDAVTIELVQVRNGKEEMLADQNSHQLSYELIEGRWQTGFRIRITNNLDVPLYCCIPYLSAWFGSKMELLNPPVSRLEPKLTNSLPLEGGEWVNHLQDAVRFYNWPDQVEHLKFIFSTDEFDPAALVLEELPPPTTVAHRGEKGVLDLSSNTPQVKRGWVTKLVTLRFQNPLYNKTGEEEITEMLQNEETINFAWGLYFNNDNLNGKDCLAQFATNRMITRRAWHYKQMIRRFPNKPRVIAESDSSFPLSDVTSIIDYVSRVFPVYLLADGDTLRSSGSAEWSNSVMKAIEKVKPSFLLVSSVENQIPAEANYKEQVHLIQLKHGKSEDLQQLAMQLIQQMDAIVKDKNLNAVELEAGEVLRDGGNIFWGNPSQADQAHRQEQEQEIVREWKVP